MTKYELKESTMELREREAREIKPGCVYCRDGEEPKTLASFDSKEEALEALKPYKADIREFNTGSGRCYQVTEWYVEEVEYDEDGELLNSPCVWAFSPMEFRLVDDDGKLHGSHDNMADAMDAFNRLLDDDDVWGLKIEY